MIAVEHVAPREMKVIELPEPEPGPGQVRVALRAGGICGSDLHVYRREPWKHCRVLGHEPSGVVDAVGPGVDPGRVGDRVSVYHYEGCGFCEWCRRGERFWCGDKQALGWHLLGSSAEKIVMAAQNALPLPDGLSFADGAILACGAATSWSALTKIRPDASHTAAVFGLGPVGLCGVAILAAFGVRVIAVGRRASRLKLAETMGAEVVIDEAAESNPAARVREWSGGGTDLAYETTGVPEAQRALVKSLARFGRAACVGIGNKDPAINLSALVGGQLTLVGSHVMNFGEYDRMVRFLLRHEIRLERIITHRFPLEQGPEAFATADRGDCAKVILESGG